MYNISDELIQKYAVSGPRYTSYPTAPMWHDISPETQKEWYTDCGKNEKPLSLYIHIPFCEERCLYCGCNVIITKQHEQSATYVDYVLREIEQLAETLQVQKKIIQLHIGGGTPTFLKNDEFVQIMEKVRSLFEFEENAEIAIEVDPRITTHEQIELLSELGFNRLSLGVQDLDPEVQKAVNRIQPVELTQGIVEKARSLNFHGINIDLIYGLPKQSGESFSKTLEVINELRPDRLAVYNFAYLPDHYPYHRKISEMDLPDSKTKLDILFRTIDAFCGAGYEYIGMDHFATPEDELSIALNNRTLYRNFMGYTAKSGMDMYGIGVSSIGDFGNHFVQNEKKLSRYKKSIDERAMAGAKGMTLSDDDIKRKWTILRMICHFYLSFNEFEKEFSCSFHEYYADEMLDLQGMQHDGLLEITKEGIRILDNGKILIRNVCMVFDAYLKKPSASKVKYSKTI
ncbi:MAG: oxygen-independent coproporphyrinogen-3 oxidase [bacterium]|jgi:oxygen-independent coproporphyrinogen-3 oxidase